MDGNLVRLPQILTRFLLFFMALQFLSANVDSEVLSDKSLFTSDRHCVSVLWHKVTLATNVGL